MANGIPTKKHSLNCCESKLPRSIKRNEAALPKSRAASIRYGKRPTYNIRLKKTLRSTLCQDNLKLGVIPFLPSQLVYWSSEISVLINKYVEPASILKEEGHFHIVKYLITAYPPAIVCFRQIAMSFTLYVMRNPSIISA